MTPSRVIWAGFAGGGLRPGRGRTVEVMGAERGCRWRAIGLVVTLCIGLVAAGCRDDATVTELRVVAGGTHDAAGRHE